MELREGYIRTEAGVIPKSWDMRRIKDIGTVSAGGTPSRENLSYWGGNIPWITTSEINFRTITNASQFITELGLKNSPAKLLPAGTLLLALYGQGKTRGKVGMLGIKAATNQACAAISVHKNMSIKFLHFYLESQYEVIRNSSNSGSQENLNGNIVKNILVVVPSFEEQTAIANALSDTDALIQSLQKLITKKRQIKRGAMQTLLNPYENGVLKEGWGKKKLGDVLRMGHGRSQHDVIDQNGEFPILASGGEIGRANKFLYDKPSVLIGRKGTIDAPQFMDKPFWTIDTLFYSEIFEPNNPKYLFYQFQMIDWYSYNEASGVPSLSARTIEKIEIDMPPAEDQTSIANILSNMDTEISSLESQLAKYQKIKQGMMQNLLTGRIRLV